MKKVVFVFFLMLASFSLFAEDLSFLYMAQSGYQPPDILSRTAEFYRKTGIEVHVFFPQYEERYEKIIESFAAGSSPYDVILIDLIWVKDFVARSYLDELPDSLTSWVRDGIVPEIYSAFQYDKTLWAVPFHADFQLLFINRKLLSDAGFATLPRTLEEMVHMAKAAKEAGLLKYPLFDSWNRQEVLVCEYSWLTAAFGGQLTDKNGKIDLLNDGSKSALGFMVSLLTDGLMNPYSLQADELLASEVFLSGDCLFTTNWTFLIELIRKSSLPIANEWQLALMPVSQRGVDAGLSTVSISGYEGLGVPSNSRHRCDAWQFVQFLSSPDFQKKHLDYMSVWKEVWSEDTTVENDPYIELKERQIEGVIGRPATENYQTISCIIQQWIYKALLLETSPEVALRSAQEEIDAIQQ